jgi:hypothetical protein
VALAAVTPLGDASKDVLPLNAFTVDGTVLRVFALSPGGTRWMFTQSLRIPLEYGSSG